MAESKYVSGRDGTSRGSYTLVTDAGAEIKTAYEAEANAFTDTKNTKLAGIEDNATAGGGESEMPAHLEADDPHGDRAYARSLVFAPEATVTDFQANPATGILTSGERINDNVLSYGSEYNPLNKYAIVDFGKFVKIRRWRQYGDLDNIGNGSWKIQYISPDTMVWVDWVMGIATRSSQSWSAYSLEEIRVTDQIKLIVTGVDSGTKASCIRELEVIY